MQAWFSMFSKACVRCAQLLQGSSADEASVTVGFSTPVSSHATKRKAESLNSKQASQVM